MASARQPAACIMASIGGMLRSFIVVNSFIAMQTADCLWVVMFNFLRNQTHVGCRRSLVVEFNNILTVVGFTHALNVFLKPRV